MLSEATLTSPRRYCERLLWGGSLGEGHSYARVLSLTHGRFFFLRLYHVIQTCEMEHQPQMPCYDFTMSSWTIAQNIGSVLPLHSIFYAGLSILGTQSIRNWSVLRIEWLLRDMGIFPYDITGHDCCMGLECTSMGWGLFWAENHQGPRLREKLGYFL